MRQNMLVLFAVIVCLSLSGCGSSPVQQYEAVLDEYMQLLEEYFAAIDGIKDPLTGAAAAQKIDGVTEKFEALYQRFKNLPTIDEEEHKGLKQKYGSELGKMTARFHQAGIIIGTKAQSSRPRIKEATVRFFATLKKFDSLIMRLRNA